MCKRFREKDKECPSKKKPVLPLTPPLIIRQFARINLNDVKDVSNLPNQRR